MNGKILSLVESLGRTPPTAPAMVRERCLRRRLNTCDCRLCLDACGAGALSLIDRQVFFEAAKCTGCHRCAAACPNETFVAVKDPQEIIRLVAGRTRTGFSCFRQRPRYDYEIPIPCLGMFSAEMLLSLGRSGCGTILFNTDGCATCCNNRAFEHFLATLRQVMAEASELLPGELAVAAGTAEERAAPSRRSFFAGVRAGMKVFLRERCTDPVTESGPGRRLPLRTRLVEDLLHGAEGSEKDRLRSLITPTLTVTDGCTACPRCTGICPTGALRAGGNGPGKRLLFAASRCSSCGLCVAFCKEAALSLTPPLIFQRELPAA